MAKILLVFLAYFLCSVFSFCPFHPFKSSSSHSHSTTTTASSNETNSTSTPLQGQLPITTNLSDPYVMTNSYFRLYYSQTKSQMLPQVKILHESDYLVLILSNGSRYIEPIVEDLYHNLKMISHIPVTIYILLLPNQTKSINLSPATMVDLQNYQDMISNLAITVERFPSAEQYQRQIKILNQSNSFLSKVLQEGACSFTTLSDWTWNISNDINLNLDDAASNSINLIHNAVMKWKDNILTDEDWNELYVTTLGSHMSSQESLHRQYFQRLFNLTTTTPLECGEYQGWNTYETKSFQLDGGNYLYEEEIIDVIGTHYNDYPMGRDFFHSLYRMHKDALADGAKKALDVIFGPLEEQTDDDNDDNNQQNGDSNDSNGNSAKYFAILGLLFVPGLLIGAYFGLKRGNNRRRRSSSREIDITTNTSTNIIHATKTDIERR